MSDVMHIMRLIWGLLGVLLNTYIWKLNGHWLINSMIGEDFSK